jgi:putative salt-induced outer membrane protein YdiY
VKHPFKLLLLCTTLACLSFSAHAIVNLEQAIIGPTKDGFHNRLDFTASGNSGNTENKRYMLDLLTLYQHNVNTEFLQLHYAYGTSLGQIDTDNAFAHFRHRTEVGTDWGIEGFAQISRDPFSRLTERTLLGGGVRWILLEKSQQSAAYLGLGAFHEHEIRTEVLGTTDLVVLDLWRANGYLILKYQLNGQIRLVNNAYYQPALDDINNYRLLDQGSVLIKLDDHLDLKMSIEISYDSIPPQTVQANDTYYSTGLSFSF